MAERRASRLADTQPLLPFQSKPLLAPRAPANTDGLRQQSPDADERSRLLTVRQVCDHLQCSRTYAYELLQQGEIHALKLGRLTRIPLSELERFIAQRVADARYDVCARWSSGGDRDAL